MRTRSLRALILAIGATLALTGLAAAGGYATAQLDAPPDDPTAGEPVEIGFTLLQHGVTPVSSGPTNLDVIDAGTGERTSFVAAPSGTAGHWVAEVTFPTRGVYRFEIRHDLEIQSINLEETTLSVGGTGSAVPAAATTSAPAATASALPWVILAGAALLTGSILLLVLRPIGRGRAVA